MSKHVVFKPVDLSKNDDQIKETILWAAKFNLHPKIESDLPPAIVDIVKKQSDIRYPLAYWEKEFENLGFHKDFDFPYCKEFVWDFVVEDAVRITIKAADINTNFNQIIVPKNLAKQILDEMALPLFGKMHPEKFHTKLIGYIDLSQSNFALEDKIFDVLTELEDLCAECITYESYIEWKVS